MGTHTALHLASTDLGQIEEICADWLRTTHPKRTVSRETGTFPLRAFARISADDPPTLFALGVAHPGWTSLHYNSFHPMEALATRLSRQLRCRGVVVLAQTVADAYYIAVYEAGELTRQLECSEAEGWLAQEGAPLPFEGEPLGKNIAEPGEEPYYFFGAQEAEAYCQGLGFSIFGETYEPEWVILKAERRSWWPFRR